MSYSKLSINKLPFKQVQEAVRAEALKVAVSTTKKLRDELQKNTPEDTGYTKKSWIIEQKNNINVARSWKTMAAKGSMFTVNLVVKNPSRAVQFLRKRYTQRGNQLIFAKVKSNRRLKVLGILNLNPDLTVKTRAQKKKENRKRKLYASKSQSRGNVIKLVTHPGKVIIPGIMDKHNRQAYRSLSLEDKYINKMHKEQEKKGGEKFATFETVERKVRKHFQQLIRRSTYLSGTASIKFMYKNLFRKSNKDPEYIEIEGY